MNKLLQKKIIKKEISLIHFLFLTTSKLAIGIGVGASFSKVAFPYSYPLVVLGVSILLPTLIYLMKEERKEEKLLEKKLKKI